MAAENSALQSHKYIQFLNIFKYKIFTLNWNYIWKDELLQGTRSNNTNPLINWAKSFK